MKILSWNVHGLGRPRTVSRLKNKLRAINSQILFLIETKLSAKKMEMVRLKCGFENGIDIGSMGSREGLSLGWKGNSLVNLISFSSYHIDVEVNDTVCGDKWRLTGFYGNPNERGRSASWNLLRQLSNNNSLLWVVLGDFNETANSFEKKEGRRRSEHQMLAFRTALEDCNLTDLGFRGRWFTWERGRFSSTNIRERLDRGAATLNWLELFPSFQVDHLTHSFSDHCPILLDTVGVERFDYNNNLNSLRFEAKWCLEFSFEELVRAEIAEAQLGLNLEADKEELFWEQRARVNWLQNGDHNTSFFHIMAGQHQVWSRIAELEDESGNRFSANKEMIKIALGYFEKLFFASETGKINPALKAPGVDSFVAFFYQRYWHIVGSDIGGYCLDILNGQKEFGDINKTCIVLILKIDKPKNMAHFRPISLCNVIYKIIAKVMVNRMSDILGDCINEAQGAFILGRLISDNVLIAYEVLHSLKMKKSGMMKSLGFHDDWIALVMRCVCSVSYSVFLNGMCSDWFSPSRDDCILFGDATSEGVRTVRDIIREYEINAGQRVNYDKSLIFFGANVKEEVKEDITRVLGVRVASSPKKYLGLPMMVGRRKAWVFANFKDRFRKRVDGWSLRYLSMGRKEVFIKSILQATPLYAMQYFLFPMKLCSQLENIMNRFWWANNKMKSGIHWSCWDALCLPKFDGGLGFKNLFLFNKALLAKQVWHILTQPQCLLARVLKTRYFPFTDILVAKVGSYPSFTWRSICSARALIEESMLWRIGKGDRVNIWNDPLLLGRENNRITGHEVRIRWTTVNHLMQSDSSTWNEELIRSLVVTIRILSIPISGGSSEDTLVCKFEGSGVYSVRSGYGLISRSEPNLLTILNSTGIILGVETYLLENVANPFVAEARACERALLFVKSIGFHRLAVEGDALSVIKSIKKMGNGKSVIRSITQHIYLMGLSFDMISYRFVRRAVNGVSHILALEGRRIGFFGEWVHGFPDSVSSLACKERLQLNLES
ncbi:reverse transcriptase [Gossypium australe]|uniref:Reverse transcriptase n=1 Tax=Gossypium australe TaxID=47621 RepID=A0A5B6UBD8_9ROSI|nr:reverse transcriptase [Gossypium australe]